MVLLVVLLVCMIMYNAIEDMIWVEWCFSLYYLCVGNLERHAIEDMIWVEWCLLLYYLCVGNLERHRKLKGKKVQ